MPAALEVRDLVKRYGAFTAVDGISLEVMRKEILCVVGESGSGKSVMCKSILRLLPEPHVRVSGGRIIYEGQDLLALPEDGIRSVRGGRVYGTWPGLSPDKRYDGRDLAVTTDFRDVFGEVVTRHLGLPDARPIFPGYASSPSKYPGLFA